MTTKFTVPVVPVVPRFKMKFKMKNEIKVRRNDIILVKKPEIQVKKPEIQVKKNEIQVSW